MKPIVNSGLVIRPETHEDYHHVANITLEAFDYHTTETILVALQRQRTTYDPELALVAELNGEVVGHVLFSPEVIGFMGERIQAVNLAPIAVNPAYHGRGIGSALIREGHRIAASKSYAISYLLGHDTYYPRFGYRVNTFGTSKIQADVAQLPNAEDVETRSPTVADLKGLFALWKYEESNVDFSAHPGVQLLSWISPNPQIQSRVHVRDGKLIGYSRMRHNSDEIDVLFANDDHSARQIVRVLSHGKAKMTLNLHPSSASAGAFGQPIVTPWRAGMACSLYGNQLDAYFAEVLADRRAVGRPIWHTVFDLA